MDVGVCFNLVSKLLTHLPVPVRAGAIPPPVPNAKNQPRAECQQDANKVEQSRWFPQPAKQIEQGESRVKDEKKDVEQGK